MKTSIFLLGLGGTRRRLRAVAGEGVGKRNGGVYTVYFRLRRAPVPTTVLIIKIELYTFEVLFWGYYFEMNDRNGGA